MQGVYEFAPVIADVISAHCPGTTARERFTRAYLGGHWDEAEGMVEGMLSEPWHLPARLAPSPRDDHASQIVRELRETVVFTGQSLLADAPFSQLDLLSCAICSST